MHGQNQIKSDVHMEVYSGSILVTLNWVGIRLFPSELNFSVLKIEVKCEF